MRKGSYSEELVKINFHVENLSLPPRVTEGTATRRGVAPFERRHQLKLNLRRDSSDFAPHNRHCVGGFASTFWSCANLHPAASCVGQNLEDPADSDEDGLSAEIEAVVLEMSSCSLSDLTGTPRTSSSLFLQQSIASIAVAHPPVWHVGQQYSAFMCALLLGSDSFAFLPLVGSSLCVGSSLSVRSLMLHLLILAEIGNMPAPLQW